MSVWARAPQGRRRTLSVSLAHPAEAAAVHLVHTPLPVVSWARRGYDRNSRLARHSLYAMTCDDDAEL